MRKIREVLRLRLDRPAAPSWTRLHRAMVGANFQRGLSHRPRRELRGLHSGARRCAGRAKHLGVCVKLRRFVARPPAWHPQHR